MSTQRNSPARNPAAEQAPLSQRLPPRILASESPEEALAKKQAREHKDAQVRGVASIHDMRLAIKRVGRDLPAISEVPRLGRLDAAAFRARAELGLPFLIGGVVGRWPLAALTPHTLRSATAICRCARGWATISTRPSRRTGPCRTCPCWRIWTWSPPARATCRPIWAIWNCAN